MQHIMTILYFITYLYKFEQISNINRRMNIEQSMIFDVDEVIDITTAPITSVLSFTMSITKKYSIIGTQRGFCLIDNSKKSFRRFQADKNPFKAEENTGVQLGTALEQRTEVAVIPTRKSQKFNKNTVYIFDYQLNTILYSNDFFLPIRQMTLIDDTIIVSNNKRIVIYNYSNDTEIKTQEFYLKMYQSRVPNNHIRYLEMSCEEKISNNSIEEFEGNQNGHLYKECLCGKYSISGVKPYKLLYSKVFTVNGSKNIQLSLYDWAFDKDYVLQSLNYNEPFSFTISEDGNFIAYSTNEGRNICVMKLGQKKVFCNLSISSSIKNCISCGFFSYDDALWFTSIRNGDNSNGHMHFFKIQKKKQEGQIIKPRYSRYFSLFQRTMADYGICNKLIGPQFYVINGAVNSSSVCGAVVEIIDLKISGNHIKKTVQNLLKWKEEIY